MFVVFVDTFPLIVAMLLFAVVTLPLTVSTLFSTLCNDDVNAFDVADNDEMFVVFVDTFPLIVL